MITTGVVILRDWEISRPTTNSNYSTTDISRITPWTGSYSGNVSIKNDSKDCSVNPLSPKRGVEGFSGHNKSSRLSLQN